MIYFFENYNEFSAEKFIDFLPENRRKKLDSIKLKRDRENCIVSYLLLRKALRNYSIENFEIAIGENGKPYLEHYNNIFFNISHTNSGVAVVVDENPVGIDVQDILRVRESVMDRCFSDDEKEKVHCSSEPERVFTRLWTLKESAVKCNAETVAFLKNYCFDSDEKSFKNFGKIFTVFERKNLFISACGSRDFLQIIECKTKEEIL